LLVLAGLEEYGSDKSKCQEHFDIYKECKKKEVMDLLSMFKFSV
jgi:cytochrome c oxidase assembly protein subunit 23